MNHLSNSYPVSTSSSIRRSQRGGGGDVFEKKEPPPTTATTSSGGGLMITTPPPDPSTPPTTRRLPPKNNSNNGMREAMKNSSFTTYQDSMSTFGEPLPADELLDEESQQRANPDRPANDQPEDLVRQVAKDTKVEYRKFWICLIIMLSFVATAATVVGLNHHKNKTKSNNNNNSQEEDDEEGPVLPPSATSLVSLYEALPESSRERLKTIGSPQSMAWDWMMNHPNINKVEDWRKVQLYAISTLFYSLGGPQWVVEVSDNHNHNNNKDSDSTTTTTYNNPWMKMMNGVDINTNTNECTWLEVMDHIQYDWKYESATSGIGSNTYQQADYRPCNDKGEIQTINLQQLQWTASSADAAADGIATVDSPATTTRTKPIIQMPPQIGLLTSLRLLGIRFSELDVPLDHILIPELIGLPNLVGLNLQDSRLHGSIPAKGIGQMASLRHLILAENELSGTIPTEVASMLKLEMLHLGETQHLKGSLPSQLGLLSRLTYLDVFRNSLTGKIPTQLGFLHRMEAIILHVNALTGSIPSEFGSLTSTTRLHVQENRLTGSIPSQLGRLTNLQSYLDVKNNQLGGPIPSQLGLLTDLIHLYLGNNNFVSSIPTQLGQLSQLQELYLSNIPSLSGQIPTQLFTTMPNLTLLSLSGSHLLSGSLPDRLCTIDALFFDCTDSLCGCDCSC